MKKFRFNIFYYILFSFILVQCSSVKTNTVNKNFLWKISSDKATVYLLGSIHLAKESLYPLNPVIENAFAESNNLVVELNIDKINPFDLVKKVMYQDDNSLEKNVSKEIYAKLKSMFDKNGVPEIAYAKAHPWFATVMLVNLELKANGYDEKNGIDQHFLNKADEKRILELETMDEQLSLFNEFDNFSAEFVDYSLNDLKNTTEQVDDLYHAWSTGNAEHFEKLIDVTTEENPKLEVVFNKLIKERNIKMAEKISGYLKSNGKYFVVVGAGHIIGKSGILSLIKEKNKYKVEQL
ncbi:MAG: TraB/GumN family protein [Ignavibacteriae bacterium]|nr:TraB/GumN family protein [Ignavibacteriota bacterium]